MSHVLFLYRKKVKITKKKNITENRKKKKYCSKMGQNLGASRLKICYQQGYPV